MSEVAKVENREIAATETKTPATDQSGQILSVISQAASNPDVDVDKMKALLDMQERVLNKQAESAFNSAFVAMQSDGLRVVKRAANDQTRSLYATLNDIQDALIPVASSHGFAITFGTDDSPHDNYVRVTADLIHSGGHTKRYHYDSPFDTHGIKGSQNKTLTHGKGSAITYGQRYLTTLIFNITLISDDDGNAANSAESLKKITTDQETLLNDLMSEVGQDVAKFLEHYQISSVSDLPARYYTQAKHGLEAKQ